MSTLKIASGTWSGARALRLLLSALCSLALGFTVLSAPASAALQAPTIGSTATSAPIGSSVHDVATLYGANGATGTITFNLYGPSDTADCTGTPVFTSTVGISGPGNYGSGNFTPATAGKYYWIASYSGDTNNLPASGSCGDAGETSTISKRTTGMGSSATSQAIGGSVHDVATLSGATAIPTTRSAPSRPTWTSSPTPTCQTTPAVGLTGSSWRARPAPRRQAATPTGRAASRRR